MRRLRWLMKSSWNRWVCIWSALSTKFTRIWNSTILSRTSWSWISSSSWLSSRWNCYIRRLSCCRYSNRCLLYNYFRKCSIKISINFDNTLCNFQYILEILIKISISLYKFPILIFAKYRKRMTYFLTIIIS